MGFWKQLVDYEHSLFEANSVKIIPSAIGYIPDIYESEVRSMQWAKSNPTSAGTLAALNSQVNAHKEKRIEPTIGKSLTKIDYKNNNEVPSIRINKINYTTTYKTSFQKP